jgi:hypothetical protein
MASMPEGEKFMNSRKIRKLVTFHAPFQLQAMDEARPAGVYQVTTEEEQLGDFMFEAFHRTSTSIYLPPRKGDFGMGQIIPVDLAELAALFMGRHQSPAS